MLTHHALLQALIVGALSLGSTAAHADWPCTVLLCMLNPKGPMSVAACQAPVRQLWRHLARGRSWPICQGAGNTQTHITTTTPESCHPTLKVPHEEHTADWRCLARYSLEIRLDGKPQARAWFDIEGSPEQAVTEYLGGDAHAGRQ